MCQYRFFSIQLFNLLLVTIGTVAIDQPPPPGDDNNVQPPPKLQPPKMHQTPPRQLVFIIVLWYYFENFPPIIASRRLTATDGSCKDCLGSFYFTFDVCAFLSICNILLISPPFLKHFTQTQKRWSKVHYLRFKGTKV